MTREAPPAPRQSASRAASLFAHSPRIRARVGNPSTFGRAAMTKFLVLYMAKGEDFERMMKSATPEQQQKGMQAWMKWMGDHQASIVDGGAPLGKSKRVDAKGT